MAEKTGISWTDSTWNPLRGVLGNWHCVQISPGCNNCYAQTLNMRFGGPAYTKGADTYRLHEPAFTELRRWKEPRRIFVCSMCDLFEQDVTDEMIHGVFRAMLMAPQHTYQLLTKRPARMSRVLRAFFSGASIPANWWVGATIESDEYTWRADHLRDIPAAVRWISAEPLLGPLISLDLDGIHWLVSGGESGAGFRPCHPDWVRDLRDRCRLAGVSFNHKQWSGLTSKAGGRLLDGVLRDELPDGQGGITHEQVAADAKLYLPGMLAASTSDAL